MTVKRQKIKLNSPNGASRANRWAGAVLGVAAVAGSAWAQPSSSGQAAGRDSKARPNATGAYLLPNAHQAPAKVQQAKLTQDLTPEEFKKLTPAEKAQLRLLLKSGQ
jgi:hypothetical protein